MQCASCRFENMPGSVACGRCGARLEFTTAIDVHPPRARPAAKRLRRWFPWYGSVVRMRDVLAAVVRTGLPQWESPQVAAGVFVRMAVPGWPQKFMGQATRGRIMLAAYLAALFPGIVFVGTVLGSFFLGLALAVHAASVIDVLWAGTSDVRARVSSAAICLLVLGAVVYFPVTWAVARVAVPRRLTMDAAPFLAGDALLYNPSAYWRSDPLPGEVVLYRIPPQQVQGRTPQGYDAVYRIDGEFIDRLLAGPGQKIAWEQGALWIDGQPSPWLPLNPAGVPVKLQWTVPDGCYLVLPSTLPHDTAVYPPDVWARMSVVPRGSILGRVFLRHQPLTRWWWVR